MKETTKQKINKGKNEKILFEKKKTKQNQIWNVNFDLRDDDYEETKLRKKKCVKTG